VSFWNVLRGLELTSPSHTKPTLLRLQQLPSLA
jgi:hypothetical protein